MNPTVNIKFPSNTASVTFPDTTIAMSLNQVGPAGPTGATGAGVPTGGITSQVLAKNSNTNYDTLWETLATVATTGAYSSLSGLPTLGTLAALNSIDLTANVGSTVLPIANGGTGSSTQNFVDLSSTQTIAGAKSFTTSVGSSTSYVPNIYGSRLYLNSTAYLDGSTAGQIGVTGNFNFTSTTPLMYIGSIPVARLDSTSKNNAAFGEWAMSGLTTGSNSGAFGAYALNSMTSGQRNMGFGPNALYNVTTTNDNIGVGSYAGYSATGQENVFIGPNAGFNSAGSNNIIIGYNAGYNQTSSNVFMIDAFYRANAAAEIAGAILYGTLNSTASSQQLTVNAALNINGLPAFQGTNTTGSGSAALGSNSPATTNTAPYTWIEAKSSDGSTVYIPCWK